MRLDHIAYRVADRDKTAGFFKAALGYTIVDDFNIEFDDGSSAQCYAMEPLEKISNIPPQMFNFMGNVSLLDEHGMYNEKIMDYHLAPEVFVSHGAPGSIVHEWVSQRGGVGGIHHLAYEVESVETIMKDWQEKGYAEFTTDEPLKCPGLTQCFTKPSELTGVIYEFIEREGKGFCKDNVKGLMNSTKGLS